MQNYLTTLAEAENYISQSPPYKLLVRVGGKRNLWEIWGRDEQRLPFPVHPGWTSECLDARCRWGQWSSPSPLCPGRVRTSSGLHVTAPSTLFTCRRLAVVQRDSSHPGVRPTILSMEFPAKSAKVAVCAWLLLFPPRTHLAHCSMFRGNCWMTFLWSPRSTFQAFTSRCVKVQCLE